MQRLDEPLDMSLKSRKRSPVHEYLPKKKRASVIARSTTSTIDGAESVRHVGNGILPKIEVKVEVDSSSPPSTPPPSSPPLTGNGRNSHILNDLLTGGGYERPVPVMSLPENSTQESYYPGSQRVIINSEVEGGLEEHFRRSLCREFCDDIETAGVDAHFSRSLGSAKWEEIQRTNQQLSKSLDLSMPSARKKKAKK